MNKLADWVDVVSVAGSGGPKVLVGAERGDRDKWRTQVGRAGVKGQSFISTTRLLLAAFILPSRAALVDSLI